MNQILSIPRALICSFLATVIAICVGGVASLHFFYGSQDFLPAVLMHVVSGVHTLFLFGFLPLLYLCRKDLSFLHSGYLVIWGGLVGFCWTGWLLIILSSATEIEGAFVGLLLFFPFAFFVLLPLCRNKGSFLHAPRVKRWAVRVELLIPVLLVAVIAVPHLSDSIDSTSAIFFSTILASLLEGVLATFLFQKFGGVTASAILDD